LAVLGLLSAAWALAASEPVPPSGPSTLSGIDVAFKLEAWRTRSLHMGDRWVSPPTYSTSRPGTSATLVARVEGVDATGRRLLIQPAWVAADPALVTITPAEGREVKIVVRGAGATRVQISTGGVTKDLVLKATQKDNRLHVEIVQVAPTGTLEAEERARLLPGPKEKESYAVGVDLGRRLKLKRPALDVGLVSRGLREALEEGKTSAAGNSALNSPLEDQARRESHAVGRELGTKLAASSMDLDAAVAARGIESALRNERPLLTEGELQSALAGLQMTFRARRAETRKRIAAENRQEGEAFLARNKAQDGVVTLASGLQYEVLKTGVGSTPALDDTVVCHYKGTLVDGTVFDSSLAQDKPSALPLKRLIRGWREALLMMPVGSQWRIFIPSRLAYGTRGVPGKVGPNETLVFEVELLSIQAPRPAEPLPRQQATTAP
jgi:FKBP-type peptidyl-prolyl cis-trans isomerase FklB